jgi:large subunit ribosomal protein L13
MKSAKVTKAIKGWHIIDARGQSLGRVATKAAEILQGKHDAAYAPNLNLSKVVLIKNISQAVFTGKKIDQKQYHSYSGYPGGLKTQSLLSLWQKRPKEVVRKVVYQMLPANRLRKSRIGRLKVSE